MDDLIKEDILRKEVDPKIIITSKIKMNQEMRTTTK